MRFEFLNSSQFARGRQNITASVPCKDFSNEWQEVFKMPFN